MEGFFRRITPRFRHFSYLTDLFALAMVDETIAAVERRLIDQFIEQAEIPLHLVDQFQTQGRRKAEELIRNALSEAD